MATRWAEEFTVGHDFTRRAFQRRSAPAIARVAVVGIAEAVFPDPDSLLYELLATVTSDCTNGLVRTRPATSRAQLTEAFVRRQRPHRKVRLEVDFHSDTLLLGGLT